MLCVGFGIKWGEEQLLEVLGRGDDGPIATDGVRFVEAETAMAMGIPFNEHWYSIEPAAREQMIAARLARTAISNLQHIKATA